MQKPCFLFAHLLKSVQNNTTIYVQTEASLDQLVCLDPCISQFHLLSGLVQQDQDVLSSLLEKHGTLTWK